MDDEPGCVRLLHLPRSRWRRCCATRRARTQLRPFPPSSACVTAFILSDKSPACSALLSSAPCKHILPTHWWVTGSKEVKIDNRAIIIIAHTRSTHTEDEGSGWWSCLWCWTCSLDHRQEEKLFLLITWLKLTSSFYLLKVLVSLMEHLSFPQFCCRQGRII